MKQFIYTLIGFLFVSVSINAAMRLGGTNAPGPSAMLDLNPDDTNNATRGLVLPRVQLQSTTLAAPLTNHVKGMFVYNTTTIGDVSEGIYYNDGSKWVKASPALDTNTEYTDGHGLTLNDYEFNVDMISIADSLAKHNTFINNMGDSIAAHFSETDLGDTIINYVNMHITTNIEVSSPRKTITVTDGNSANIKLEANVASIADSLVENSTFVTQLGDTIAVYFSETVLGDTIIRYISNNLNTSVINLGDSIAQYITKNFENTTLGDTIINYISNNVTQKLTDSIMSNTSITSDDNTVTITGSGTSNVDLSVNTTTLGKTLVNNKTFVTNLGDSIAYYFPQIALRDTVLQYISSVSSGVVSLTGSGGGVEVTGSAGNPNVKLINGTTNGQILKWNSITSKWELDEDNDTDTNTTYTEGTAITITGAGNAIGVKNGGITSTQIANATILEDDLSSELLTKIQKADNDEDGEIGNEVVDIAVAPNNTLLITGTKASGYTLSVKDRGITSAQIANGTILENNLSSELLTKIQKADNDEDREIGNEVVDITVGNSLNITGTKASGYTLSVKDGGITSTQIANGAVSSDKILNSTIATIDIADDAVTSDKIVDGTIAAEDIANAAVTTDKIAANSVTTAKIVNKTILGEDINPMSATTGQALIWNGSNWTPATITDNNTTYNEGTAINIISNEISVEDGGITTTQILNGTITAADIATGAVTSTQILNATIAPEDIASDAVTNAKLADNAVNTAEIVNSAVTSAKIANATILAEDLNHMNAIKGQALTWNGSTWAPATIIRQLDITPSTTAGSFTTQNLIISGTTSATTADIKIIDIEPVFSDFAMAADYLKVTTNAQLSASPASIQWIVNIENNNNQTAISNRVTKIIITYECSTPLTAGTHVVKDIAGY
jgi:hypothetical protein